MALIQVDIVIFGGGIAGLWTLTRLRQQGYQAILLESDQLGSDQTGASQGIIHGGTKYALTGRLTHSSQTIQAMPALWRQCLSGCGSIDLSAVNILSEHQYLWSADNIAARLTGFFASKVMTSRMKKLSYQHYPKTFSKPEFDGAVYQLDEPVLDSRSLISELAAVNKNHVFQYTAESIHGDTDGGYTIKNTRFADIQARLLIFTAGNGNQQLLQLSGNSQPEMQQRPLFMPMLKAAAADLPLLYAHCLGVRALPRITITSHLIRNKHNQDEHVWYLGGDIAEQGVDLSLDEQIIAAKKELAELLPWMHFNNSLWSALRVNRAEPLMADGSRPSEPFVHQQHNTITAWPVKLAMTPLMCDKIVDLITPLNVRANAEKINIRGLKPAKTADLPWQREIIWKP